MLEEIQKDVRYTIAPLISDILNDSQKLIGKEIALAKNEIKEDLNNAARYVILLLSTAISLLFAFLLFSFMLAYLIADLYPAIPLWKSFGLVGLFVSVISIGLSIRTSILKEKLSITTKKTVSTIKEALNGQH